MAPTRPAIELGRDPGTFTNGSSFVEVSLSERYTRVRFPYSCLLGRRHYRARYGAIASALECPLAVRSPKSQRRIVNEFRSIQYDSGAVEHCALRAPQTRRTRG